MADFKPIFYAVNSDFFGDGVLEENTAPLSTYKENVINARNLRLLEQRHSLEVPFRTAEEPGDNGLLRADYNWRVICFKPIYLQPETTKLRVDIEGKPVLDRFDRSYGGDGRVSLAVSTWRSSPEGFVLEDATDGRFFDGREPIGPGDANNLTLIDGPQFIELNLENRNYETNTLRWVAVETRCGFVTDEEGNRVPDATLLDDFTFNILTQALGDSGVENINETNRGGASPGVAGIHRGLPGFSKEDFRQMIFKWRFRDKIDDDEADDDVNFSNYTQYIGQWERAHPTGGSETHLMTPVPYEPDRVSLTDAIDLELYAVAMPDIKRLVITPINEAPSSEPERYRLKNARSMEPQTAIRGTDVVDHVDLADHLMERWHPVYTSTNVSFQDGGNAGQFDDDEFSPEGEEGTYRAFSFINNTSEGDVSIEIPAGVLYEEGEIEIQLSLFGIDFGLHPSTGGNFTDQGQQFKQPDDFESVSAEDDADYVDFRADLLTNVVLTNTENTENYGNLIENVRVDLWRPSYSPARVIQMAWPLMNFEKIYRGRRPFTEKISGEDNYRQLSAATSRFQDQEFGLRLYSGNNCTWWDDETNTTGQHARLFNNPRLRISYSGHNPAEPLIIKLDINSVFSSDFIIANQAKYPVLDEEDNSNINLDNYQVLLRDVTIFARGAT